MEQSLMIGILIHLFLYGMDGIVWIFSVKWILTGFYGYSSKRVKWQIPIFVGIIIGNAIIMVFLYYLNKENNANVGVTYPIISIFYIIYWMIVLQEHSKLKRFLSILFAANLVSEFFIWISSIQYMLPFQIKESPAINILLTFTQQISILAIAWILGRISSKNRKEPMRFSLIISSTIACVLLDMVINIFSVDPNGKTHPLVALRLVISKEYIDSVIGLSVFGISFILLMIFFIMLIRESESDYFQRKNTINEYYLETQKDHYENLIQTNHEIRKIKHDMKNHIYCLQELCHNKQYDDIEEYLGQIEESFSHVENNVKVGNEIADAILSDKLSKAKEKNIQIEINGVLYDVGLKAIDICTIFANMTDNAMEAVEKLPEEQRLIKLSLRKNNHFLLISEKNPMEKKLEIVDNSVFTTKKDRSNHGFGIINIKDAIAKYDGECVIQVLEENEGEYWFQMDLMIPL